MTTLRSYDRIISLGSSCQTAYQLRRLKLRQDAGPFDWFISQSIPGVAKLFHTGFRDFMALSQLELAGKAQQHYIVRDTNYLVYSYHDFPLTLPENNWHRDYNAFKEKIDRRVNRFMETLSLSPSILIVRTQLTQEDARRLQQAIHSWIETPHYTLLAVNDQADPACTEVTREEWGLPHVQAVRLPKGSDWRGSDAAWTRLFDMQW